MTRALGCYWPAFEVRDRTSIRVSFRRMKFAAMVFSLLICRAWRIHQGSGIGCDRDKRAIQRA
jgi:hypothetical protein